MSLPYPLHALMEVAETRHAALASRTVEIADFAPTMPEPSVLSEHSRLCNDMMGDVTRFFLMGLEPSGLALQIMQNAPVKELRANCHQAVDDRDLQQTVAFIHDHLEVTRKGNALAVRPTWVDATAEFDLNWLVG